MNPSIHRVGLAVAAFAVLVTVGGFYVAEGYLSTQPAAASSPGGPSPEVVYVRPAASPQVIHVTQTAPPGAPNLVHVVVPGAGEPGDGAQDGGDG